MTCPRPGGFAVKRLLPLVPDALVVERVARGEDAVMILAAPRRGRACCPRCGRASDRRHGSYARRLEDLPWQGRRVSLTVRVRRLRCANPACPQRTFGEGMDGVAGRHARRTARLRALQRQIGLALGGEPGARLAGRLATPVSGDTLLRLVREGAAPSRPAPRIVGVDEWAWRKGRRYGTILVDLERNRIVDLLPDRDAGSFAAWLSRHPGVAVVARDRAGVYAEGARMGAPDAAQVADRWHLLCNLGVAMEAVVARRHADVRAVVEALRAERLATLRAAVERRPLAHEIAARERRAPRLLRHAEMVRLHAAGASKSALARRFGMTKKTVRRWLRAEAPPDWRKPPRPTLLDPWRGHLERRWREGCRNAAELAREIDRLGAAVKPRLVRAWATARRKLDPDSLDAPPGAVALGPPPSFTRIARLVQADPLALEPEDRAFVERLLARSPEIAAAAAVARRFADLLRRRSDETLDAWLADARASPLARFAKGLGQDLAAVRNAVAMPWSTSPVEGQISRLKTLKRQMAGRAGFELLRRRVLERA
jgi:transposase